MGAARKLEAVPVMPTFSGNVHSIQGERQEARQLDLFASQENVDEYVRKSDDGVLACRESGRHPFPPTRQHGLRFNGVDPETGLMTRYVDCPSCELAYRVELWDVQHEGNKVTRCELVSAATKYRTQYLNDGTVRRYIAPPGHGRMQPKRIRNAIATGLLGGMSYSALRKEAMQAQRKRTETS